MAEDKKIKIDSLPKAVTVNSTDVIPVVQGLSGSRSTKAADIAQVGEEVVTSQTYSGLGTTSKTVLGAINELASDPGASALADLTDVQISSPTDGQVIKYDSDSDKWVNAADEGGGTATEITYDNTTSGLSSVNVQGAVDELAAMLDTLRGLGLNYTYVNIQSAEYTESSL